MLSVTRYILRQLVIVTVFITVALTAAVWLSQSLRFMDYIVNRGLPATDFISFVILLMPTFLGVVLPIAAFCAVLFVYNRLLGDSEMVVLRSAGFSQLQLAGPALILGLVVTLLVYGVSLYVMPVSYRAFSDLQERIRSDYSAVLLQAGTFNTLGDDITVYVRERAPEGELLGILVHDTREPKKPVTMMAERGAVVRTENGPRVLLVNGSRQSVQGEGEDGRLTMLYFDRYTVDVGRIAGPSENRWHEPKERFLGRLFNPDMENPSDKRFATELIAEGHRRLVYPFYTFVFVVVAVAALLAGEFNRRGQIPRILAAAICVALLEAAAVGLTDLSTRTLRAVPVMYAVPALSLAAAWTVLIRRPRRRPPPRRTSQQPALEAGQ